MVFKKLTVFYFIPMVQVILQKGKDKRISNGHPWVFANEVGRIEGEYANGDIVEVYNFRNNFLGKGYINNQSQMIVRILSHKKTEEIDAVFFRNKIQTAWEYRKQIGYEKNGRIVFGEADGLSGLIVDKFEDLLVIQLLTLGMDIRKEIIVSILKELFNPRGIYERSDAGVRTLEGLPLFKGHLMDPFQSPFQMKQDGISFWVDVVNGQKTGFFHDQRKNRLAIQPFVKNATVLDACCYTGSFSMYAAKFGAKRVVGLDISEEAIIGSRKNAKLNQFANCEFKEVNVFDELKKMVFEEQQFDVVMLDPPSFTKNRKNLTTALKGYKEINRRGIQLVKPGGYLVTSSCSHFIYPEEFKAIVTEAANDAGRTLRQVVFQSQSPDHPYIWNIPETHYLKFAILQVL